jgi:hypothetical protein
VNPPSSLTLLVGARIDYRADVTVLENQASGLPCFPDGDIHHGAGQVVGRNRLIGEQHPKRRVDHSQQPVAEIRFLARLRGVDIRGPKYVNAGEPAASSAFSAYPL